MTEERCDKTKDWVGQQEWISCKDRVPPDNSYGESMTVLVYLPPEYEFDEWFMSSGRYFYKTNEWEVNGSLETEMDQVTHWMPLPCPPKENSNGN